MWKFWINSIFYLVWINLIFLFDPVFTDTVRVDPLAQLSATLKTYQKTGCDSEYISLSCPRGTSISIEVAQYGKPGGDESVDSLCPATTDNIVLDRIHSGTEIEIKTPESCLWPNALQYSLVQTVVEACQKKTHCKFSALPKSFRGDPCPGVRRFVDVAYKCRPYEFRSKVACENDVIQLICNPYSRIAIYSASYGRTEYESIQCSQPQGVREETCLVSYATETVMGFCHGRRRCNISADSTTFGKPCQPDSRMYLKVVYTCVPRKVLKEDYDTPAEPDEPHQIELENSLDDIYDDDQFYRESEAIPPAPKLQGEITKIQQTSDTTLIDITSIEPPIKTKEGNNLEVIKKISRNSNSIKFNDNFQNSIKNVKNSDFLEDETVFVDRNQLLIVQWIYMRSYVTKNQERLYLYLIIVLTAGILICFSLLIARLIIQRRRINKETKIHTSNTGETTLPNGFSDDISEIDADIDLTTPLPIPSVSRNEPTFNTYNPSMGPYPTSMVPPNISQHTSTQMLVPASSLIGPGGQPPSGIRSGSILIPHSMSSPMGTLAMQPTNTLPHRTGPPSYLTGSIVGHGTLRRPHHDVEATLPRSLIRGAENAQYYYG